MLVGSMEVVKYQVLRIMPDNQADCCLFVQILNECEVMARIILMSHPARVRGLKLLC